MPSTSRAVQEIAPRKKRHEFAGLNESVSLTPVDPNTDEYKQIARYLSSTQGHTHHLNAELLDILRIEKPDNRPTPEYVGQKMLLWHGTRRNYLTSILNHGLLKNPPGHDTRHAGMFGRGVYFADSFSKSAAYSMKADNEGTAYIFLAEVSLGKMFPLFESESQQVINMITDAGYHSVKGCGKSTSSKSDHHHNGQHNIPSGKLEQNPYATSSLQYNEFIVYDDNRIKLKYLVYIKDNNNGMRV